MSPRPGFLFHLSTIAIVSRCLQGHHSLFLLSPFRLFYYGSTYKRRYAKILTSVPLKLRMKASNVLIWLLFISASPNLTYNNLPKIHCGQICKSGTQLFSGFDRPMLAAGPYPTP